MAPSAFLVPEVWAVLPEHLAGAPGVSYPAFSSLQSVAPPSAVHYAILVPKVSRVHSAPVPGPPYSAA